MLIPLALRQTVLLRRAYNPVSLRQFSVSPRPQAAENEDSFIAKFKHTAVFQQLADKPEALLAIQKFAELLQKSGMTYIVVWQTALTSHLKELIRPRECRQK